MAFHWNGLLIVNNQISKTSFVKMQYDQEKIQGNSTPVTLVHSYRFQLSLIG